MGPQSGTPPHAPRLLPSFLHRLQRHIKCQRLHHACGICTYYTKVRQVKAVVFPVVMYRCESWTIKAPEYQYWCFWTVVLEKTIESPLDSKIKPVNPKGNQSWIFIGRTGAEAEAPILWPPDVKSQLIRKDLTLGKIEGKRKKGMAENEIVEWHHWLKEHEFKQAPGDGEGQGSLACCRPWGHKESDTTKQLNNNNNNTIYGLPWWLRW